MPFALTWKLGWLPTLALAMGSVGVTLTAVGVQSPVRALLALLFLVTGPGAAAVGWLRGMDRLAQLAVALATSITVDCLVAEAMLLAGAWSPTAGVLAVAAVTSGLVMVQCVQRDAGAAARESHRE